nr:MAG TPA: hypothetical protein [Caudoviricetes sp.]
MTFIVLGFVAFVAIIFVGVVIGKRLDNEEGK